MESFAQNEVSTNNEASNQNPSTSPRPISEFAGREDFPECLRGRWVDIGGYAGLVADIVNNSLKVRSTEGTTRSFNYYTLKRIYGPREELPPMPQMSAPAEPEKPVEKPRNVIENPNFDAPVKPIQEFVKRPDFPQCALGEHVDIGGYVGVVVEIIDRSIKVRSREETTRRYNADGLKKVYGDK